MYRWGLSDEFCQDIRLIVLMDLVDSHYLRFLYLWFGLFVDPETGQSGRSTVDVRPATLSPTIFFSFIYFTFCTFADVS